MKTNQTLAVIARVALTVLLIPITSVACGQINAVSNLDETASGNFNVVQFAFAQSFTTGDVPRRLNTVTVDVQSDLVGSSRMFLRRDFDGRPGAFVEHLGSQIIQGGSSQAVYPSNSNSVLEANTTYWLTLGEAGSGLGSFDWRATTSTAQASPEGWTLGDQIAFNDGDGWEEFSLGPANESGRLSIDVLPVGAFVPPSMQGDVNMDGDVDFLDIGPFIVVLSSGMFQVEADTNNDGDVSFLDIELGSSRS